MTHKIHISSEKENPVHIRKEVLGFIEGESTPSFKEVEELISDKYKTSAEHIKVNSIQGKFGSKKFAVNAFIYKSVEQKNKLEPKTRKKRAEENKAKIEARKANKATKSESKAMEEAQ